MTDAETALDKVSKSRSIKDSDLKELLDNLSPEAQERIKISITEKINDERLKGTWEDVENLISYEMCKNLRNAVYKKIKSGGAYGGKSGDALNKFYLKILDKMEDLEKLMLPKQNINLNVKVDSETTKEILVARGIIPTKVIDVESKEVKE